MAAGRSLYVRVGVLVLAGVALAAGFVLFLAGGRGIERAAVFETYVTESVQGLDVGAPVRFRGVAIGRVTEIALASATYRRPEGTPFGVAFQLVMVRFAVDLARVGDVPELDDAVRAGLRARITSQGITGVNYVELDFVNPARFPVAPVPWTPRYPILPAIPSTVAQVTNVVELLAERLAALPIEQAARDATALVATLSRQANEADLPGALREVGETAVLLRRLLEAADLPGLVAELRGTVADTRALVAGRDARAAAAATAAAATDLRRATQRLPQTLETLERTLRVTQDTTSDLQAELIPVLADLRATAANLRAASETIRSSPGQALFGAPPAPGRPR